MTIKKIIVNRTVVFTTVLFLLISAGILSCCKKDKIILKTCGKNEMLRNDSCVCDNNSFWNGSECKFAIKDIKTKFLGHTHLMLPISNNCGDWRDSIIFPFVDDLDKLNTGILAQLKYDSVYTSGDFEISYYKNGIQYDTLASDLGSLYQKGSIWGKEFAIYMRMTKSRDTMWATVCNVQSPPEFPIYKRIDTCHVILTKLY
jgi:hypothetical protein